jgi:hypothetical protein
MSNIIKRIITKTHDLFRVKLLKRITLKSRVVKFFLFLVTRLTFTRLLDTLLKPDIINLVGHVN